MADFSQYAGASNEWLEVAKTLQAPSLHKPVSEFQKQMNAGAEEAARAEFKAQNLSSEVVTKDYSIPTRDGSAVEARTYRPSNVDASQRLPIFLCFHGGGFILGALSGQDVVCARIAIAARGLVVNVNYRHTPDHIYPIAWLDTQDAFAWVHEHVDEIKGDGSRVVVGGTSAGGQLAASLILEQHLAAPATCGPQLHILTPITHPDPNYTSYEENADAPMLPVKLIKFFTDLLKMERVSPLDVKLNPGLATPEQVKGLPPTVFSMAGLDPLRDEGLLYAKLLAENGVPTNVHVFKGVPHAFRRLGQKLSVNEKWDEVVNGGIKWCLSKPAASGKFEVKVFDK